MPSDWSPQSFTSIAVYGSVQLIKLLWPSLLFKRPSECLPMRHAKSLLNQNYNTRNKGHPHSILIFMKPSLVSVMPCRPILLGPNEGVILTLPPLFDLSPAAWPPEPCPFAFVAVPHRLPSRCAGDCDSTGLFWTLTPGETARRLMECPSRSSSRLRLLDFFSASAAVGGASGCGVEDRDMYPE